MVCGQRYEALSSDVGQVLASLTAAVSYHRKFQSTSICWGVGCASKLLILYIRLLHNYIFCWRSRLLRVKPTLINRMLLILFRTSNLAVLTSL